MNHKLVPISHKLRSGDQVEIITSQQTKTIEDWLNFVVTAKARSKIKDALKEEKRKIAEEGKYTLQRKLEGMGAAFNQHNIDELVHYYKLNSPLDLFYQIAVKNIDLKELKEFHGARRQASKPPKPVKTTEKSNQTALSTSLQKRCRADHFWGKQRQDHVYACQLLQTHSRR